MSYATRGMNHLTGTHVGWTNPSTTYEKMRQTNVAATILDGDMRLYASDTLKTAWMKWYSAWTQFFETTMQTMNKLGVVLSMSTDELAAQSEAYRQDLARFQATYAAQKDPQGNPLPSNSPPVPITQLPGAEPKEGLPLWAFALGAVLIGGTVFFVYSMRKAAQELAAKKDVLERRVLPMVMSSTMGPQLGPAFAEAAVARDGVPCGCSHTANDPGPRPALKYLLTSE